MKRVLTEDCEEALYCFCTATLYRSCIDMYIFVKDPITIQRVDTS